MRLLIADDQLSLHKFLNKMMDWSSMGITEVRHAYNGKQAAELTESFAPNLLIIDIHMPEWNGIEALKHIQHLDIKPKTVILSAYDQFEYAKEALRLNVSHYMLKPVDAVQMKEVLLEFIRDISLETRMIAIRELEKAAGAERYSDVCIAAVKAAFAANGILTYAALTIRGPRAGYSWPQLDFKGTADIITLPLAPRESEGECCVLLGLRAHGVLAMQQGESWLAAWRMQHQGCTFTLGFSESEEDVTELSARMEQSRAAAKQAFYAANLVYRYRSGLYADAAVLRAIRQEALLLEEKLRKGYDAKAGIGLIGEFLVSARRRRVEPDSLCELAHRLLFVLTSSHTDEQCRYINDFITLQAFRQSCSTFDDLLSVFKEQAEAHFAGLAAVLPQHDPIRKIKKYIDTNFEADLSLQTVADLFQIDRFRLSREFKQEFDENYWTYVTRIRMEQAASFLRQTSLRNSMIAERTGYCDESHFSRAFKKHYGVSPREYRGGAAERNN